jgi:hypothetical protein
MIKTERMTLEEALIVTTPVCTFSAENLDIKSIISAIESYEKSLLEDYDTEFMLIINKKAVTNVNTIFTNSDSLNGYQPATKMEAIKNHYMGSLQIAIAMQDMIQLLDCSIYFNFEKEECELRAKVNGINGVNLEELHRQAVEDLQLRKALDLLVEKGLAEKSVLQTIDQPRI